VRVFNSALDRATAYIESLGTAPMIDREIEIIKA